MACDHRHTIARRASRLPSEHRADVLGAAAHPRLGEAERHDLRVVAQARNQEGLHEADAPRVHRLRRVRAVGIVRERRRAARERAFSLARLNVVEGNLDRSGLGRRVARRVEHREDCRSTQASPPHGILRSRALRNFAPGCPAAAPRGLLS